jgi:hypothetical protein
LLQPHGLQQLQQRLLLPAHHHLQVLLLGQLQLLLPAVLQHLEAYWRSPSPNLPPSPNPASINSDPAQAACEIQQQKQFLQDKPATHSDNMPKPGNSNLKGIPEVYKETAGTR